MTASKPPTVRKGQGEWPLSREVVQARFHERFVDPAFDEARESIEQLAETAWQNYRASRKAPHTRRAGAGFADPDYDLSVDWLAARDAVIEAGNRHADRNAPSSVLLICGASRNDKTCPGEISKTFRLATTARESFEAADVAVDFLDLSALTSDYGRVIYPCKACVSSAMPLCHWPCSCYPNHALAQTNDWMNELYPRWVAAHGVLIVTPVYWYQAPAGLKAMMDRLVCADGGNPDPTSTHGKNVEEAKNLELKGWNYPRHLAGRAFGVIVHGDAAGAGVLRRALTDWLTDIKLTAAEQASIDRYVGYYQPYATSHEALDEDRAIFDETRLVAQSLIRKIAALRSGAVAEPAPVEPRPK